MTPTLSKQKLILRSLLIAGGLMGFKLTVFLMTNSVAILASTVDSLMDLVLSLVNFLFLKSAAKPADHNHPYGHGKIESLAGLLQSLVIGAVTLGVAASAVRRLYHPEPIEQPLAGLLVMLVALGFNFWHVRHLKVSMLKTESPVMATEYLHFVADTYVYLGVIGSLILVHVTGFPLWDVILSLLIVLSLFKNVFKIFGNSLAELLDKQLPETVLNDIDQAIRNFHPQVIDYHDLRTRKVGPTKFIEFHVVLRDVVRFDEAHELTEGLIQKLKAMYPGSIVTVHTDPEGALEPEHS